MSVTVATIITQMDTFFRDASTDSISAAERLQAVNEATVWLIENTTNDHTKRTYDIDYVAGLHTYKISSALADVLEPADLRRTEAYQTEPATRKAPREMVEDIANGSREFAFAVERKDGAAYLLINLDGRYQQQAVASFDSLTADGGTWAASNDASNVSAESSELTQGSGSIEFDVSGSTTLGTISGTINSLDLTDYEDIGVFTLDVYIPDATYTSSVTLYWGNSDSVYYSLAQTTDAQGNAIADGWNTFKFAWIDATQTGTVDETLIDYIRVDVTYGASQAADTGYRLDNLNIAHPERLVFHYLSDRVGTSSGGTTLYRYTATTDIPFYSAQYDHYIYPVAHKAASILFKAVGLLQDARSEEDAANDTLASKIKLFPSSMIKEDRAFKVKSINMRRRKF